jgi:hypothetical protein
MKIVNKIRNIKLKFSTSIKRKKKGKPKGKYFLKTHENRNCKTLEKTILRKPKTNERKQKR